MRIKAALSAFVAATLLVLFTPPAGAAPRPRRTVPPPIGAVKPVPGNGFTARPRPADPAQAAALRSIPAPTWPTTGSADVTLPAARPGGGDRVRAGGLPVWVGPTGGAGVTAPGSVRVEVADAKAAGVPDGRGLAVRLSRADGGTGAARVSVQVDVSGFRWAYGGDWVSRLRFTDAGRPLRTVADPGTDRVTADVDVPAGGTLLALAAGPSGGAGNYAATSLAPSASWSAGGSAGDFTWSYDLPVPPAEGGPAPKVTLSYDAGGIDGRTGESNNQPSWVGEGFDYWPGYIERSYRSCTDDTAGGTPKTGDLCWGTDNATLSLGGRSTELVRDDGTGMWRLRDDDGSRVERLTGGSNDTYNGEYWRLTTPDGTQYYFGLDHLPGQPDASRTYSAWHVPVFGNQSGEPCHAATFDASWCQQGWRWNLDYVVDPHNNTLSYHYQAETNQYGRDLDPAKNTPYTRGGYLVSAEYGTRAGGTDPAPQRVMFDVAERCVPDGAPACAPDKLTTATAASWPDVPYDQNCNANETCTGRTAPTFWTRKRLRDVRTQVRTGTGYRDVDEWDLTQTFPQPGDGTTPGLWLASITHTGKATGTPITLPPVTFNGFTAVNRVNPTDGLPPLAKWRIGSIFTETGGQIAIDYSTPQCDKNALPAADANTQLCFPEYRPDLDRLDWFNKYVVHTVTAADLVAGDPAEVTEYRYQGAAAWHYDDTELVPTAHRTWSGWRGYGQVITYHGQPADQRSQTDVTYFRGMNGDHLANGGTRSATVTDSAGGSMPDDDALAGRVRETIVHNGAGGAEVSEQLDDPSQWATATRARPGDPAGPLTAYLVRTGTVRTRTALASGGYRRTQVDTAFDGNGLPVRVDDHGDTATATDDRCTRTTYAQDTTRWLLDYPARIEVVAVACGATPTYPRDAVSDKRTYYDGSTTVGTPPVHGDTTRTDKLASYVDGAPVYTVDTRADYDANGRPTATYDALDHKTTTAYTPATGGPVTGTTVTGPTGFVTTTVLDPAWGSPTGRTDANGHTTVLGYDALGRLDAVWLPDRPTSTTPSMKYAYQVRTDGPAVVSTARLTNNGTGYITTYQLSDGLLRVRQTQAPAPAGHGGRVITDTLYDSRGLPATTRQQYYDTAPPSGTLFVAHDTDVPAETVTTYDGAERPITVAHVELGATKWQTTTAYAGDHTDTTPPAGGTATTTYTDARGHTTQLRQYRGATPSGAYDETSYTYDAADRLTSVTTAANDQWTYEHDLRGRVIKTTDPDRGTTLSSYDDIDELTSTTDARGQNLTYTYDALGRKTGEYQGSTLLTEWTYDTVAKGQPASTTRYDNGAAYTKAVTGYDALDRPTGTSVTIPASEGALAGTYAFSESYTPGGAVASLGFPAAGGLPAETVRYAYDDAGRPLTVTGTSPYVVESLYDELGRIGRYTLAASDNTPATWLSYGYDPGTGRLNRSATTVDATPSALADAHYSYDPAGNVTKIADTAGSDTQCFRYDNLRRLITAWTATDDCAATPSASVLGGPAPYWQSYAYDIAGDRTSAVDHGATPGTGDTTHTYAYPVPGSAGPAHGVTTMTTTGASGTHQDAYTYDAAGNTKSRGSQALTWDAEGHLATLGNETYTYDADGNRLLARDPAASTLYLPGEDLRLDKATGTVTATRYYTHGGSQVAMRTPAGLTWLGADPHGTDTIAVKAADGTATIRRYTPFGTPRGTTPTWPNSRGFLNGPVDPTTGITHLGARDYDPSLGRFLSVDPLAAPDDPQQLNGYAYADNSPVTDSDPTGEMVDNGCYGNCSGTYVVDDDKEEHTLHHSGGDHYTYNAGPAYQERPRASHSTKPSGLNRSGPPNVVAQREADAERRKMIEITLTITRAAAAAQKIERHFNLDAGPFTSAWCVWKGPVECLESGLLGQRAADTAFDWRKRGLLKGYGEQNAFRHAYWMALLVEAGYSAEDLRLLGIAHEMDGITPGHLYGSHDSQVDLYNNTQGIRIGQDLRQQVVPRSYQTVRTQQEVLSWLHHGYLDASGG